MEDYVTAEKVLEAAEEPGRVYSDRRIAMMLFKAEDVAFVPVGCDYESTLAYLKRDVTPLWQKLPSPEAAGRLGYYVKEWLGILFYSFRKPAPGPVKENAKATAGGKAKGEAKAA